MLALGISAPWMPTPGYFPPWLDVFPRYGLCRVAGRETEKSATKGDWASGRAPLPRVNWPSVSMTCLEPFRGSERLAFGRSWMSFPPAQEDAKTKPKLEVNLSEGPDPPNEDLLPRRRRPNTS